MALRDQPYLPLYVQDFMTDEKLAECSAASTGVYIRLMCLMHKSEHYGKILLKQKDKQKDKQITNFAFKLFRHLPYMPDEIEEALQELINAGVLQLDGDYLLQKRMIRDCELSEKRSSAGKSGVSKRMDFAQANPKAKSSANSENEDEDEIHDHSLGKEMQEGNPLSNWREDFEIYLIQLEGALEKIKTSTEFIAKQQRFYPGINIPLSLEKACENYWATKKGWEHKKRSKSVNIDWKATLQNALTIQSNQVKAQPHYDPERTRY